MSYQSQVASTVPAKSHFFTIFIALISLVVLIGVIALWWYWPRPKHATVMGPFVLSGDNGTPVPNSIKPILDHSQIYSALGNNFTLGMFVYMDDVNIERIPMGGPKGDFRFKPFLYILGVGDILLDPIHQMARIRIKPLTRDGVFRPDTITNIDIDNFMISRWNQLVITVEGRTVDIYLNGALAKSTLLDNLPIITPAGVLLETSPDFSGQAGLFQAWPNRLSESNIARNYRVNTDTRGKPLIPDLNYSFLQMIKDLRDSLCKKGFCDFNFQSGPLQYIDYEYA